MPRTADPVWFHVKCTSTGKIHPLVTCKYCSKVWRSNSKERVEKHLAKCKYLPAELAIKWQKPAAQQIQNLSVSSAGGGIRTLENDGYQSMTKARLDTVQEAYARYIFEMGQPFNQTATPAFLGFIQKICPGFRLPSREYLSTTLLNRIYEQNKARVFTAIQQARYVSIVADGWTNSRGDTMINYLAITQDQSYFLESTSGETDCHTAAYISQVLSGIIKRIGASKVIAVTTDNASNMRTAVSEVEKALPHIIGIGCTAHMTNLLVNDICRTFPAITSTLDQSIKVALYFRTRSIETVQLQQEPDYIRRQFVLPGDTGWQGRVDCCRSIMCNEKALRSFALTADPQKHSMRIRSADDLRIWQEVHIILNDTLYCQNLAALVSLLGVFLQVSRALVTDRPRLSHVHRDYNWLLSQQYTATLVDPEKLRRLIVARFRKVYHPIMSIAHLADITERVKRPEHRIPLEQMASVEQWIAKHYHGDDMKIRSIIHMLHMLRNNIGLFSLTGKWSQHTLCSSIEWWETYWLETAPELAKLCIVALMIPPAVGAARPHSRASDHLQNPRHPRLSQDQLSKLTFLYWNLPTEDRLKETREVSGEDQSMDDTKQDDTEEFVNDSELDEFDIFERNISLVPVEEDSRGLDQDLDMGTSILL